jgi:hypothetical protein
MTQSRVTTMRMTLSKEEEARYHKIKNWYRTNVDREVNVEAEVYILERILTGKPVKGGALHKIGEGDVDDDYVMIDIFDKGVE